MLDLTESTFGVNLMNVVLGASTAGFLILVLIDVLRDAAANRRSHHHGHALAHRFAEFVHHHFVHHHH